jgi:transcription termination factor Rho
LSERRVFPAIDLLRSSTRRDDLLLTKEEQEATALMRRMFNGAKAEESLESIMRTFQSTKNNAEFVQMVKKIR